MTTLDSQQWKPLQDRLNLLSGVQVSLALIAHLTGISGIETELEKAKDKVSSAKVGDKLHDAYGCTYVRIK